MAYTEFRKSYGDFEIVIAPVNFSCLTKPEARLTVNALQEYERGYVCDTLRLYRCREAIDCIGYMLQQCYGHNTVGGAVITTHSWLYDEKCCPYLGPETTSGITLRKAWVKHLISDIMREHELETAD